MGVLLKYTTYLLRRTAKKCPQRIKDTPAVLFCCTSCIYIASFKRLTEGGSAGGVGSHCVLPHLQ